jgi:hypothetical protein
MESRLIRLEVKVDGLTKSIDELKKAIDFLERQIIRTYYQGGSGGSPSPTMNRSGLGVLGISIRRLFAFFFSKKTF